MDFRTVEASKPTGRLTVVLAASALFGSLVPGCYLSHEIPVECDAGVICRTCTQGSCNHDTGEGCARGEGCYIVAADPETGAITTGCLRTRSRPSGASCAAPSDCESGLACFMGPEHSPPGFCAPICCGVRRCPSEMACQPTRAIDPELDAGTGAMTEPGLCVLPTTWCDVVDQSGCGGGRACYFAPNPTCMAPGTLGPGEACSAIADCAPGLVCIAEPDGSARCHRVCADDAGCPPRTRCEPRPGLTWTRELGTCH